MSKSILPLFSFRSFMVSCLTFSPLSHFRVRLCFFVCGEEIIQFHFLHVTVQFSPLVNETIFHPLYIPASFDIDYLTVGVWVYLQALCSVPLIYVSVFVPVPCCFDYCSFVVQAEIWKGYASSFLFPQDCLPNLGSFVVSYKF